jgi:4-hydroxy-3-methylbut-2-en-1-yl diphosphate synthase IspG/GcpE
MNNKKIYDWIIDSGLEFDQMINEFDFAWIHLSLKIEDNRKQILEAYKDDKNKTKYRLANG